MVGSGLKLQKVVKGCRGVDGGVCSYRSNLPWPQHEHNDISVSDFLDPSQIELPMLRK